MFDVNHLWRMVGDPSGSRRFGRPFDLAAAHKVTPNEAPQDQNGSGNHNAGGPQPFTLHEPHREKAKVPKSHDRAYPKPELLVASSEKKAQQKQGSGRAAGD